MSKFIAILLVVVFVGCTQSSVPNETVHMNLGDEGIANSLRGKLDSEGVWYKDVNKTTIEVISPPPAHIIDFANNASNTLLPEGRHSSFPKHMLLEVIKGLEGKQIKHKIVEFDGVPWLVWEESDSESVTAIISEVSQRLNIQEILESDFKYDLR